MPARLEGADLSIRSKEPIFGDVIFLARQGWPGDGIRLPGGALIPALAIVACLAQFPSLDWPQTLIGLALVAGGLLIYRARHRKELGEGVAPQAREAVETLDTPLMRAARSKYLP